jgi:hypothetical protein
LFIPEAYEDFRLLTFGLAASLGLPVSIFLLAASAKPRAVVEAITKPLHAGGRVLLASESHTELVSEILGAWADFAPQPDNVRMVSQSGLVLDGDALEGEPATLTGLHPAQPDGPLGYLISRIPAPEATTLEFVGNQAAIVNVREIT